MHSRAINKAGSQYALCRAQHSMDGSYSSSFVAQLSHVSTKLTTSLKGGLWYAGCICFICASLTPAASELRTSAVAALWFSSWGLKAYRPDPERARTRASWLHQDTEHGQRLSEHLFPGPVQGLRQEKQYNVLCIICVEFDVIRYASEPWGMLSIPLHIKWILTCIAICNTQYNIQL